MLILGTTDAGALERSPCSESLPVTLCAVKLRNLKPQLRKEKLFCTFSIWHLLNSCQILHCWWHFQLVCQNKCRVCHVLFVHKAVSNSDHLQPLYLVCLRRSFEMNFVVLYRQKYKQLTLWRILKLSLKISLFWIKHSWRKSSTSFWYKYSYCWHRLVTTVAECNLNTNKNPLY